MSSRRWLKRSMRSTPPSGSAETNDRQIREDCHVRIHHQPPPPAHGHGRRRRRIACRRTLPCPRGGGSCQRWCAGRRCAGALRCGQRTTALLRHASGRHRHPPPGQRHGGIVQRGGARARGSRSAAPAPDRAHRLPDPGRPATGARSQAAAIRFRHSRSGGGARRPHHHRVARRFAVRGPPLARAPRAAPASAHGAVPQRCARSGALPRRHRAAVLRQHAGHHHPRAARHREEPVGVPGAALAAGGQRADGAGQSRRHAAERAQLSRLSRRHGQSRFHRRGR